MQTATMFKITPHIKREIIEIIDERVKGVHVTKEDFSELKAIVQNLGINVGELAIAQKRTEAKVSELASAQKRSEERLTRVEIVVGELASAQKRTEDELTLFRRTFSFILGGLGARWGIMTEASFRNAISGILVDLGFKTERFRIKDKEGMVFGYSEDVGLDVVIQNGKSVCYRD